MEIPVQVVQKVEKKYYEQQQQQQNYPRQQEKQVTIIKQKDELVELPIYNKNYQQRQYEREFYQQQQQQQQQEQGYYYKQQQQYINETEFYGQRKYRYTLPLEQIYQQDEFNYFQQKQQLENLFVAKLKKNLRVVVLKFRKNEYYQQQQQQQTELKTKYIQRRIVVLPRYVQADTVKVVYVKEQRQILVKARFQPNIEQLLQQETERQLLQRYPLPVEYQLATYRLLKRLVKNDIRYLLNPQQQQQQFELEQYGFVQQQQQPFYVPRIVLCQKTYKQKLLLEVNTRYNRPQELLQVELEPTKQAVVIYADRVNKQLQHEFYLPNKYFKLEKVTYIKRQDKFYEQPQNQQLTIVLPFRKYARQNFF